MFGLFILSFFFDDQVVKFIFQKFLPDMVSFNTGVAFNIPIPNQIMIILTPILLVGFFLLAQKYFDLAAAASKMVVGLIIGGGLGNFIDRLLFGAVRDFINLGFWPSFNLADTFITVGAVVLILFHGKILKAPQ